MTTNNVILVATYIQTHVRIFRVPVVWYLEKTLSTDLIATVKAVTSTQKQTTLITGKKSTTDLQAIEEEMLLETKTH
jgi:ERCC4-type nuclease